MTRSILLMMPPDEYTRALGQAFMRQEVNAWLFPVGSVAAAAVRNIDHERLAKGLDEFQPTEAFGLTFPKTLYPELNKCPYHCWLWDPPDAVLSGGIQADRIWNLFAYLCHRYGGGWLPPATDHGRFFAEGEVEYKRDIGFIGSLPADVDKVQDKAEVQGFSFDKYFAILPMLKQMIPHMRAFTHDPGTADAILWRAQVETGVYLDNDEFPQVAYHIAIRLQRRILREYVAQWLIALIDSYPWTLDLVGPNWRKDERYAPYAKLNIWAADKQAEFYHSTKVNLQFSSDCNLHSRLMDILASGGFIMCLKMQTDEQPDSLRTYFPQDVVPTFADAVELEEKLKYYLTHEKERLYAIEKGREIVAHYFNYDVLAKKVLDYDLPSMLRE